MPGCIAGSPLQSRQQELQILAREVLDEAVVGVEDGVGEVALALLELEDLLLDGVAADQAVGEDVLGLADPVRAVDGLGFDGGVPPGVEQVDIFGGGQVQAEAAGLEADQEDRDVRGRSGTARRARRGCGSGRRGIRT